MRERCVLSSITFAEGVGFKRNNGCLAFDAKWPLGIFNNYKLLQRSKIFWNNIKASRITEFTTCLLRRSTRT